jgi:plastocyanin
MAAIPPEGLRTFFKTVCLAAVGMAFGLARAADLIVDVRDGRNAAVENAVVEISKLDPPPLSPAPPVSREMRQSGKTFNPFVLVVSAGAEVAFPNRDPFRHHVYSFSKPKPFELKLYGQGYIPRVVFDKPGIVALGCNIHDQMRGYVYVAAAPRYGLTGVDGSATVENLPPGKYRASVWHPDLRDAGGTESQEFTLPEQGGHRLAFRIRLKPAMPRTVPPDIDHAADY